MLSWTVNPRLSDSSEYDVHPHMPTFAISVYQLFNMVAATQYMVVHADLQRAHITDTQTDRRQPDKENEGKSWAWKPAFSEQSNMSSQHAGSQVETVPCLTISIANHLHVCAYCRKGHHSQSWSTHCVLPDELHHTCSCSCWPAKLRGMVNELHAAGRAVVTLRHASMTSPFPTFMK